MTGKMMLLYTRSDAIVELTARHPQGDCQGEAKIFVWTEGDDLD